ncbi:MAG: phosphoadenylyl-sulfate reductase [Pseudomonadota bacterium]
MRRCSLKVIDDAPDLDRLNSVWRDVSATARIEDALDRLPGEHVLSSSFGAQAAVMLHLVTQVAPGIPVIFIDSGYHFPETYQFVDQLSARLKLNLQVARSPVSPAWQEARHGQRWDQGRTGIEAYNQQNKVLPMQTALADLDAATWFSGLRRQQASTRKDIDFVQCQWQRYKVHPIADWTDRDVHHYLSQYTLPYHPLREKGYLSIGDWHTTQSIHDVDDVSELRFRGLLRECGLHSVPDDKLS